MSVDFLAVMAASSHARVEQARAQMGEDELMRRALATPAPVPLRLSAQGFDVIAEVKLRSPAVGRLKDGGEDIGARAARYAAAGAVAVSVLTEPARFEGSLDHLREAVQALAGTGVPAMRKDFLVDPWQVAEARLAGAGGVLVIVRMLEYPALLALVEAARRFGLFALIECFDGADIAVARRLLAEPAVQGAQLLVGVNSRDLSTLQVVPGRLEALFSALPDGWPRVAESGVATPGDAARLAACGYELALIGSSLMTAPDPAALLASLLVAGRGARHA